MVKNINSSKEEDTEIVEADEVLEESETATARKPKWSLKKKLVILGGAVAGLVVGAVALGIKKSGKPAEEEEAADSEEDDEVEEDEAVEDSEETPEKVEE